MQKSVFRVNELRGECGFVTVCLLLEVALELG